MYLKLLFTISYFWLLNGLVVYKNVTTHARTRTHAHTHTHTHTGAGAWPTNLRMRKIRCQQHLDHKPAPRGSKYRLRHPDSGEMSEHLVPERVAHLERPSSIYGVASSLIWLAFPCRRRSVWRHNGGVRSGHNPDGFNNMEQIITTNQLLQNRENKQP